MSDCLFGLQGKGWAIIAADKHASYSIIEMTQDEDKIKVIDDDKLFAASGPCSDRTQV